MTTAEQFRSIVAPKNPEVPIAGVLWPHYKVVALITGLAVLLVVGIVTMNAAPAVLAGAAGGTAVWLVLGFVQRRRR
jgi:choline-glycine betaine transporter